MKALLAILQAGVNEANQRLKVSETPSAAMKLQ
jgi:hypothetical protein